MGSSSSPSKSSSVLLRFLLLSGVGMVSFLSAAVEGGDHKVVLEDCVHAGSYPYSGYRDDLETALVYLEQNTRFPHYPSVDTQAPRGDPGVYARSFCTAAPCEECLKAAAKAVFDYCPNKIFGVVELDCCSVYYGHYPFGRK